MIKNSNFKNLFLSQLFANSGDIIYIVGIISIIYTKTGQASKAAIVPILVTLGIFVSGFLSNYIYARFLKKNILLFNQLFKTMIMICIIINFLSVSNLYIIYLLVILNSFFDGFTNPIKNSLLPTIVEKEEIAKSNALMNVMNNTVQVSMWAIGGILVGVFGEISSVIITIIFYILSIFFILYLKIENDILEEKDNIFRSFINMMSDVFKIKQSNFLNITTFFEAFGHGVWVAAILIVYVNEKLNAESFWFSFINALFFLGLIIGGIYLSKSSDKLEQKEFQIIVYIPLILAFINMIYGFNTVLIIALILSIVYGFFDQVRSIIIHSYIQKVLNEKELLKTYTLNNMVYSFSFCISTFVLSTIVDLFGVAYAFLIAGMFYINCIFIGFYYKSIFIKN